jgi:hypothetical protein
VKEHESEIRKQVIDSMTHVLRSRKLGNEGKRKSKCKVETKVKIITHLFPLYEAACIIFFDSHGQSLPTLLSTYLCQVSDEPAVAGLSQTKAFALPGSPPFFLQPPYHGL